MEIQPYPPGPIEKRIRKLESMVWALLNKMFSSEPMTPEEAEDIKSSLTSIRETKKHPGKTCSQAHPGTSHETWE